MKLGSNYIAVRIQNALILSLENVQESFQLKYFGPRYKCLGGYGIYKNAF